MKRTFNVLYMTLLSVLFASAQKPSVDSSVYGKWPSLGQTEISNNGKFALYWISNVPVGSPNLHIVSTDGRWNTQLRGLMGDAYFLSDNRRVVVCMPGDSAGIFTLNSREVVYLLNIQECRVVNVGTSDWLVYKFKQDGKYIMTDLQSRMSYIFEHVVDFTFNKNKNILLIQQKSTVDSLEQDLVLVNLQSGKKTMIWSGRQCSRPVFDELGKQLAFFVKDNLSSSNDWCIWLYRVGSNVASLMVDRFIEGPQTAFSISNETLSFSRDAHTLYFRILENEANAINQHGDKELTIWSYKDKFVHSEQQPKSAIDTKIDCGFNLESHKVIRLNDGNEKILFSQEKDNNKYVLIYTRGLPDGYYNPSDRSSIFLESIKDGSRTLIKEHLNTYNTQYKEPVLSPNETFVVWFDPDSLAYFAYDIESQKYRNLSRTLPVPLYDVEDAKIGRYKGFGIASWGQEDRWLWIYDLYDIWQVDLKGATAAIDLTNGIGRKQHIVFGLIHQVNEFGPTLPVGKGILLDGYDVEDKKNGFWVLNPENKTGPEERNMDSHSYWIERIGNLGVYASAGRPQKALHSDTYLIKRMDCNESPNLFVTSNFRSFRSLSSVYPERKFNWMSSMLVKWKMLNGQISNGILYKPENFDPQKKYPIIFTYYESRSDQLHKYLTPDFSSDVLDIPSYVSKGYLVFVPDIHFVAKKGGESVLNSVVSAAEYLRSFPWVDSTRMGLQGHSYGGWETNYLVSHTHLFAAACESAGVSDWIGEYSCQPAILEIYQGPFGLGITPWAAPDAYVENSPVFSINSITTPLLMVHGTKDGLVPFGQALELFVDMKRAGKKVWLLEYHKEGHGLFGGNSASRDFTSRMEQFFNHYLKGETLPKWMVESDIQ